MKVEIRRAKRGDVREIYNLGSKVDELKFSKGAFHGKDEFFEFINKPKENIILVAVRKDKLVGFLYARIISKHWCMIDNLAVKRGFRNRKIGTLLLNRLYLVLKERNVDYVQILEEIHHKKTRNFWKEKGFKEEKVFLWADKRLR